MEVNSKMEYPPKVTAMYEAIIDLMEEGIDVNCLKVSDITRKAGIGKGTAYEYFSSKEEIIKGALQYKIKQLFQDLYEQQEKEEAFEDKIRVVLEWIGTDLKKSKAFTRLVTTEPVKFCLSHYSGSEKSEATQCSYKEFVELFDHLLETGIKQGMVTERGMLEGRVAMLSQIICLVLYLAVEQQHPEITEQQAVEWAYKNIMKLLCD